MIKVFIDGSAGTTGLRIADRLGQRQDIQLIRLPEEFRKDPAARKDAIFQADAAFLCLPDAAAIEAADVVIMDDKPSNIAKAISISKKTLRIVKQNIAFAIGIKVLVMILAAFGMASMWYAVFADVGVCFIAILNALRAMKYKA